MLEMVELLLFQTLSIALLISAVRRDTAVAISSVVWSEEVWSFDSPRRKQRRSYYTTPLEGVSEDVQQNKIVV